ncbi:MAG: hypothetical protein COB51_12625 [Moraxellaceae bacterium]|nr:MAG: hypothetical protein COB51_12625 [Moraxellaceae bacterium]
MFSSRKQPYNKAIKFIPAAKIRLPPDSLRCASAAVYGDVMFLANFSKVTMRVLEIARMKRVRNA